MESVMETTTLQVGPACFELERGGDELRSLGAVSIDGARLRNPATRFLPWFDTWEGDVFRHFRLRRLEERGAGAVLHLVARSDPDTLFQERRDSSGDICLRPTSWDADPLEAAVRICLEPASAEVDGESYTGFRYWFEYESDGTPIHRFVDRQTWELGGDLGDVNVDGSFPESRWTAPTTSGSGGTGIFSAATSGGLSR
jgi:hypothetical protein